MSTIQQLGVLTQSGLRLSPVEIQTFSGSNLINLEGPHLFRETVASDIVTEDKSIIAAFKVQKRLDLEDRLAKKVFVLVVIFQR